MKQNKKKKIKNITSFSKIFIRTLLIFVFVVLLSLFCVMGVCLIDTAYNENKGILKSPLFGAYVVVTESMVPTINVNDAIVVKRVENNKLNVGDIITFSSNDVYFKGLTITHRIVGKKLGEDGNYLYRTKGDNNDIEDSSLVSLDNIYGRVIMKLPRFGYIQNFVTSPFGFVFSIVTPVCLVIIYEMWRIFRTIKKRYMEVEII